MEDLSGRIVGEFRLEAPLGGGRLGHVYRAHNMRMNQPAAIRVMHAGLKSSPNFPAGLRQITRNMERLHHAHVVRVQGCKQDQEGAWYQVMELMEGGSLRTLLKHKFADAPDWRFSLGLDLMRQAVDALVYAHSQGVVHRDIRPEQMLLRVVESEGGESETTLLKVGDFGLSRLMGFAGGSAAETEVMTAYHSPEQRQGLPPDERSDIYSFGVVLYEMATGVSPAGEPVSDETSVRPGIAQFLPPSEVSPILREQWSGLEAIILKCLQESPSARYASAADLAADLNTLTPDAPRTPVERIRRIHVITDRNAVILSTGQPATVKIRVEIVDETAEKGGPAAGILPARDVAGPAASQDSAEHLEFEYEGLPWGMDSNSHELRGGRKSVKIALNLLVPEAPYRPARLSGDLIIRVKSRENLAQEGMAALRWTIQTAEQRLQEPPLSDAHQSDVSTIQERRPELGAGRSGQGPGTVHDSRGHTLRTDAIGTGEKASVSDKPLLDAAKFEGLSGRDHAEKKRASGFSFGWPLIAASIGIFLLIAALGVIISKRLLYAPQIAIPPPPQNVEPASIADIPFDSHDDVGDTATVSEYGLPILAETNSFQGIEAAERARRIAVRLNDIIKDLRTGEAPVTNILQGTHSGSQIIFFQYAHKESDYIGDLILTVDQDTARAYGTTPEILACWWRDLLRDHMLITLGQRPVFTVSNDSTLTQLYEQLAADEKHPPDRAHFRKIVDDLVDNSPQQYEALRTLYKRVPTNYNTVDNPPDNITDPYIKDEGVK